MRTDWHMANIASCQTGGRCDAAASGRRNSFGKAPSNTGLPRRVASVTGMVVCDRV
jgi:hypothetical protein